MKLHELKTDSDYFNDTFLRLKQFEIRMNDRDFKIGDLLLLRKLNSKMECYQPDQAILVKVKYIFQDCNYLGDGYCVLGFDYLLSGSYQTVLKYVENHFNCQ